MAGILIVAFLTVQLAAAAYACQGGRYSVSAMEDMASMTESCPEMAVDARKDGGKHDGLCLEHCQLNAKSADHFSPQIPAFLPVLVSVLETSPVPAADHVTYERGVAVARAPPLPLSILHCCYRT
ncbi:hypothetical protein LMG23994_02485 [Cupriavidus pinatubonensis]|uniref:Copper resistance protein n=1 Tax=Cupriavidus pinatubonensis TaxID=248026 RepID=A0ABN7YH56_9BURK|nr:hypothetical protein LMG23994_02485 [Cupriavidus pinatubonensis]